MNLSLDDIIRQNMLHEDKHSRQNSPLKKNFRRRDENNSQNNGLKNYWKQNSRKRQNLQNRRNWMSNSTLYLFDSIENYLPSQCESQSRGGSPLMSRSASLASFGRQSRASVRSRLDYRSLHQGQMSVKGSPCSSQLSLAGTHIFDPSKFFVTLDPSIQAHIRELIRALKDRTASLPHLLNDPMECVPRVDETDISMHLRFSQFVINKCG